jgi:hypothetical protein
MSWSKKYSRNSLVQVIAENVQDSVMDPYLLFVTSEALFHFHGNAIMQICQYIVKNIHVPYGKYQYTL